VSDHVFRASATVALIVGLAAPFVAFVIGYFAVGTLMLLVAFAILGLAALWLA
jgi:hypothetical protein